MRKRGIWVLMIFFMMVLGFGSVAMAEEGVTDKTIHIGQWGPQTGPAAPWGSVARGTGVYFKMILIVRCTTELYRARTRRHQHLNF